jgi:hypothetical protein
MSLTQIALNGRGNFVSSEILNITHTNSAAIAPWEVPDEDPVRIRYY